MTQEQLVEVLDWAWEDIEHGFGCMYGCDDDEIVRARQRRLKKLIEMLRHEQYADVVLPEVE